MTSISKKLERVQLEDTQIKLVMPKKVLDQIKWLCKEIPKVEWSGVLFYSLEGSIKDPENMVLTLQDILPMHKGTSSYTEYTFDERVINYMMDNPESDDWKMGHIHSHNTMNVFFSGTDWSELEDNAPNHNFYLSLIVNNFMEFTAKVAFIVESDKAQFVAKDENGEKYNYSVEEVVEKKLITLNCDINSPKNTIEVEDDFKKKVEGIIEAAEKRESVETTTTKSFNIGHSRTRIHPTNSKGSFMGKLNPGSNWGDDAWEDADFFPEEVRTQSLKHFAEQIEEVEEAEEELEQQIMEDFAMFVINNGADHSEFSDIEDILDHYKSFSVSPFALASNIIKNYLKIYNKFFIHVQDKDAPEMFEQMTEGVIEVLEEELYTSNINYIREMLKPVIEGLKSVLEKYKKYESSTSK
jgi:hypothetical protein